MCARYGCFLLSGKTFQIKRRRVFFFGTAFFLHEAIFQSQFQGGIYNSLIFVAGDTPVELRVFPAFVKRCVLTHQTDIILSFRQLFGNPVKQADGIFFLPRKNHMADDDTAVHQKNRFPAGNGMKDRCAGLQDHLPDGFGSNGEIIDSAGILHGKFRAEILEIRKPDVHVVFQRLNGLNAFVSAAVIDDRDVQAVPDLIQSRKNPGKIVRGGDQVDVVCALILQTEKNICQLPGADLFPVKLLTDPVVLAEAAAQRTAAEEDGSASVDAADARLFPVMEGGACRHDPVGCLAETERAGFVPAVCAAHAGTKPAVCDLILDESVIWLHV